MVKRLVKDESKCTGCRACETACSQAFYKKEDSELSCIRIKEKDEGGFAITICTQCGECAAVCNTSVIRENAKGVFLLNKKECAGCLMCVGYCPEQIMVQCHDSLEPSKCTACGICVKVCPSGAIALSE